MFWNIVNLLLVLKVFSDVAAANFGMYFIINLATFNLQSSKTSTKEPTLACDIKRLFKQKN